MRCAALPAPSRNGIGYGFFAVIGVLMYPGQIVSTSTPLPRSSMRRLSRYAMTAAFDAEYAPDPGKSPEPCDARNADERAAPGGPHRRDEGRERVHEADDVGVEHRAECRQILLDDPSMRRAKFRRWR